MLAHPAVGNVEPSSVVWCEQECRGSVQVTGVFVLCSSNVRRTSGDRAVVRQARGTCLIFDLGKEVTRQQKNQNACTRAQLEQAGDLTAPYTRMRMRDDCSSLCTPCTVRHPHENSVRMKTKHLASFLPASRNAPSLLSHLSFPHATLHRPRCTRRLRTSTRPLVSTT